MASMSKETDLAFLLEELFPSPESLRRFLYSLPIDSSELPRVLAEGSTKRIALWLVDELRRRGLVDADFFKRLVDERPDYAERIRQVQDQWLVEADRWGMPPTSELQEHRRPKAPTVLVS